jgi:SAM-dependent MidA family methyltransferase
MWLTWRAATERALYGGDGFYRRSEKPSRHFSTSVHTSSGYAAAMVRLLVDVDVGLGHPAHLDVVDIGAGGGEFVIQLGRIAPSELRSRLCITAVELGARPAGLPTEISWTAAVPERITGLVVANEWLDNVPVDVVELTAQGPRLVQVDTATGAERVGGSPNSDDQAWLARWWPLGEVGDRAEVGRPRDEVWTEVVQRMRRGVAVAIDYAHQRQTRPQHGTLAGYRHGRSVPPIPDGSCDLTAHVALDACAAAGAAAVSGDGRSGGGAGANGAGAGERRQETLLTTQRNALRMLGIRGERPPLVMAKTDPVDYLRELQRAGQEGELLDRHGLGGFGWLVQTVNFPAPAPIRASMAT